MREGRRGIKEGAEENKTGYHGGSKTKYHFLYYAESRFKRISVCIYMPIYGMEIENEYLR